jgi:hypothetical protein
LEYKKKLLPGEETTLSDFFKEMFRDRTYDRVQYIESTELAKMSALANESPNPRKVFKLGDIEDPREIYGLNNLSEFLSVHTEKGGYL